MPKHLRLALVALTVIAWGVLVLALMPAGDFLSPDVVTFARTIAVTGTIASLVVRTLQPAHELLCIGKELGRADAQRELAAGNVTPLRPALRVVGQRRATE
jgi:hypothetical protein